MLFFHLLYICSIPTPKPEVTTSTSESININVLSPELEENLRSSLKELNLSPEKIDLLVQTTKNVISDRKDRIKSHILSKTTTGLSKITTIFNDLKMFILTDLNTSLTSFNNEVCKYIVSVLNEISIPTTTTTTPKSNEEVSPSFEPSKISELYQLHFTNNFNSFLLDLENYYTNKFDDFINLITTIANEYTNVDNINIEFPNIELLLAMPVEAEEGFIVNQINLAEHLLNTYAVPNIGELKLKILKYYEDNKEKLKTEIMSKADIYYEHMIDSGFGMLDSLSIDFKQVLEDVSQEELDIIIKQVENKEN